MLTKMPTKPPASKRDASGLSLRAAMQRNTADAEKRTVEVTWTTGAAVLRRDWDGSFYEELSLDPKHVRLDRLNNGAPFLPNHDGGDVRAQLGVVEPGSVSLRDGQGVATIRFPTAGVSADADKVFQMIRDGIIQNVSVGYRVNKFEKQDGGDPKVPTYRATDWEPYEISAVAMGADDGAGFRNFTNSGTPHMESNKMTPEEIAAAEKVAQEKRSAEIKHASDEAAKTERARASGIRTAVRAAKLGDDLADSLVNDGVSLDAARAQVLEKLAAASDSVKTEQHTGIQIGEDSAEKFQRGATAWLLQKSGAGVVEKAHKAGIKGFEKIETDPGEFRGMSLSDMARESLERKGVSTRGMDRMRMIGLALTHTRAGGMATIGDFPVLFENVINKTLQAAYAVQNDTWRSFCKTYTVPDFRAANYYRSGSFGVVDSLNEHGEFKNKSIPDGEKVSISVGTKGNIIALSRQAVINDDMGALADLAAKLGRAMKLSIEVDVYAALASNGGLGPTMLDGLTMFHASHGNIGTGAAIAVSSLEADRVLMSQQKDVSGNDYLDLRPSLLLVPVGLGGAAKVINNSQYDTEVTSKFQVPNKVLGLFNSIIDTPRLQGTRRYMFADPSEYPAFAVAFLEGQGEAPFLENQLGWRTDGMEWKVRLDYGVTAFDYRGTLTNAGA